MVDKNYKNDKLYTQTKIMYMKFIMRKERIKQINKQIQRIGKKKGNRNRRKEIGRRRKEQEKQTKEENKQKRTRFVTFLSLITNIVQMLIGNMQLYFVELIADSPSFYSSS